MSGHRTVPPTSTSPAWSAGPVVLGLVLLAVMLWTGWLLGW